MKDLEGAAADAHKGVPNTGRAAPPAYVTDAMRGLTKVQRQMVIDGCLHGYVTMATVRALKSRALFYHHIDSPNGRCGPMLLTPLGKTVQGILKARANASTPVSELIGEGEAERTLNNGEPGR